MAYSNHEYVDMYLVFGACAQNAAAASEEYAVRFPNRRHPDANVIRRKETGSFQPSGMVDTGRPRSRRTLALEENVLDAVDRNPSVSTRDLARRFDVPSKSSVHSILRDHRLHPYHLTRVQPLYVNDAAHRLNYCQELVNRLNNDPDFVRRILWSDESTFTRDGVFNTHNLHHWSAQNPHATREFGHQQRFSVNVWLGVINNRIVGPIYLPNRLNAAAYINVLDQVLDDLPLAVLADMVFMHDGAPAHYAIDVQNWLNRFFPGRWIGRGGPIFWPPRSPDMNILDFFVWGYIKERVYATPPAGEQANKMYGLGLRKLLPRLHRRC